MVEDERLMVLGANPAPVTNLSDWVLLAPIRDQAKLLYWALRRDPESTRDELMLLVELDGAAELDSMLTMLAELGAVDVERDERGQLIVSAVYEMPPDGYLGPQSMTDISEGPVADGDRSLLRRTG